MRHHGDHGEGKGQLDDPKVACMLDKAKAAGAPRMPPLANPKAGSMLRACVLSLGLSGDNW